jgi:hypothetical protein
MDVSVVERGDVRVLEGSANTTFLTSVADVTRLIEACLSNRSMRVLLYSSNLPTAFFDLSSREAGTILQKLRNYRIRLAVVVDSNRPSFSTRFGEMLAEERKGRDFGIFETREAALDWLAPRD